MSENPIEGELRISATGTDATTAARKLMDLADEAHRLGFAVEGVGLSKYPGAKIEEIAPVSVDDFRARFGQDS